MISLALPIDTFETTYDLPTPADVKRHLPLTDELTHFVDQSRETIGRILLGLDPRRLLIVGPCSIHDTEAALEYAHRLQGLAAKVSSRFFIVMRTYFEKARTAWGWKGYLYDPHLDGSEDMAAGLAGARHFLLKVAELGVPASAEILDPMAHAYFDDLLSGGCIGARTSSSQPHRALASALGFPVGFKNTVDGNLQPALLGIHMARQRNGFFGITQDGRLCQSRSEGNALGYLVLRGSEKGVNWDKRSLQHASEQLHLHQIETKLVVDCSHDNCRKEARRQIEVFETLIREEMPLAGMMIESFLHGGAQRLGPREDLAYGVSITDPCLSWSETESLILKMM